MRCLAQPNEVTTMIRHCSLFKFKQGTSPQTVDEIVEQFRALAGKVPAIRSAVIGKNIGFHDDNYDIAANVQFDSIEGYREYSADKTHLKFVEDYLMPNLDSRVAVQFELDSTL
jgi:hypothetical protein